MKVIVHHLPTSCKWEVENGQDMMNFRRRMLETGRGFVIGDDKGCVYFPADVVAQSVIKVIA